MLRAATRRAEPRAGCPRENKENAVARPLQPRLKQQAGAAQPCTRPAGPADAPLKPKCPAQGRGAGGAGQAHPHTPELSKAGNATKGNRTGVLSTKQVNVQRQHAEAHPGSAYNESKVHPLRRGLLAVEDQTKRPKVAKPVAADLRKVLASVAGAKPEKPGVVSTKRVTFSEGNNPGHRSRLPMSAESDDTTDTTLPARPKVLQPQVFPHTEDEIEYQPPRAEELPWDPGFEVDFTPMLQPPSSYLYNQPRRSFADLDGPGAFVEEEVRHINYGQDDVDRDLLALCSLDEISAGALPVRSEEYMLFDPIMV